MTTETQETHFPLQWDNPADAALTWRFDPMHTPEVTTPLGFDLYMEPFIRGFGMIRLCQQNYYTYMHQAQMPPSTSNKAPVEAIHAGARRWREEVIPEVRGFDDHYRLTDFDAMATQELVRELERLVDVRVRCGQLHSMATLPWWMGMMNLIETVRELADGDDLTAVRLVQGHGSKSVEAGEALWRLSRLAESVPQVRDRLLAEDDAPGWTRVEELEHEPSARPFVEAFAQFLDEFGWRSGMFEFAAPTWKEDPSVPLDQLRAFLRMPEYDFPGEQRRLVAEREEALRAALSPLDPEKKKELETAVAAAADVVSILEDHNYYIDQRVGVLPRRLVLAAGRRLVEMGSLDQADDVFYLRRGELRSALNGQTSDLRVLVRQRKDEMERWSKITPPATVGAPPEETRPSSNDPDRFWGTHRLRSERADELRGNGASAGIARGPARVLASLNEAHRFQPGDVLVTRTTMPPWTPLFAVASAVVTETGGILSHAAVTAREYGLPAVLCVENATRAIQDGQALEVDGSNGIVRILS